MDLFSAKFISASPPHTHAGNLGSSLDSSSRRLYFSHDGGFTWQDVEENFWEFQFAALGSIVVTIPKWRPTDYVRWVGVCAVSLLFKVFTRVSLWTTAKTGFHYSNSLQFSASPLLLLSLPAAGHVMREAIGM